MECMPEKQYQHTFQKGMLNYKHSLVLANTFQRHIVYTNFQKWNTFQLHIVYTNFQKWMTTQQDKPDI